jgi:hypothetical protein
MRRRGVPEAFDAVATWKPSQSTPLWLEVATQQASRRKPKDLLTQYRLDGFVSPSALDQRLTARLDAMVLAVAESFEALLLSPVAPLGVCSALAPTAQDRTLSAVRNLEVVSDPTNVLALECARRLTVRAAEAVRVCTVHQVVRAQPVPDRPGHSPHFRMFAMAEAGPGRGEDGFEVDAIVRHVSVFDRFFDATAAIGCQFPRRRAVILSSEARDTLAERAARSLSTALPHVAVSRGPLASSYYGGARVQFGADTRSGEFCAIGDLGVFDWVARLTANHKHRFVASGLGIQLAPLLFRNAS